MFNIFKKSLTFQPVMQEADELIEQIERDPEVHDNLWQLRKDDINGDELSNFWDKALQELGSDNDFSS